MRPSLGIALIALATLSVASPTSAQHAVLSESIQTKRLRVNYRPESISGAHADAIAAAAERELDRITGVLELSKTGPFSLFLYDDVHELSEITGTKGNGGFTSGTEVHVPYDNAQTRVHELVHAVHGQLPRSGDESRNLFFHEGLANAVLEHVHGSHVHSYAAFRANAGHVLPLTEAIAATDFYAWMREHPTVDWYDVGGSWIRFLIDTYGPKKVLRYVNGTSPNKAFGVSHADLEKRWRKMLAGREISPAVEILLRRRVGEAVEFESFVKGVPANVIGEPDDWTPLHAAELHTADDGRWKREGDVIRGSQTENAWTTCELGDETYQDCVIHALVRTPVACPIQIRIGPDNQVMLVNGTFLYRADNSPAARSPSPALTPDRKTTEFYIYRRGAKIEVWIDGQKALTAPGIEGAFQVGIGLHAGEALFEDVRVRRL